MTIAELVKGNRSYRRFRQDRRIERQVLVDLVSLARFSPSGGNGQPLKFVLVHTPEDCARVFPHLAWAGRLKDWPGPAEGERPAAYILLLCDTRIAKGVGCDQGIAAQSMLLGAVEQGLGGCMIGSVQRDALHKALGLADHYQISLVVALGEPAETVVLEDARAGDVAYYRDADDAHHVPKRPLDELIVKLEQAP